MKKISIQDVRKTLLKQGFLSESESKEFSDEILKEKSFSKDLGMGSLDCLIFVELLEKGDDLSLVNLQISDNDTVGDVLARCAK